MASARARLGKANRSMIRRKKTTDVGMGALSALSTVAAFGAGQAKKSASAWDDYEAGYKELGGEGFERPKFGQKGFFKGPEGEVRIGDMRYDRGQIQKAGSFLGSNVFAALSDEQREKYLGRTAPGVATAEDLRSPVTQITGDTGVGFGKGPGMGFKGDLPNKIGIQSPDFLAGKSMGISDFEQSAMEFKNRQDGYKRSDEWAGKKRREASLHERIIQERGKTAMDQTQLDIRQDEQAQFLQDYRTDYKKRQYIAWGDYLANPPALDPAQQKAATALNKFRGVQSYARGGDFITDGPQKIDAKFGRYGDDAMKIIDGQPAHINSSIEGDMSPEDIKKYGAGTINPITGKKEYFLGTIAAGMAIGSSLYKGYQATQNKGDVQAGQTAAYDIQQEQLGLLGEQKDLALDTAQSQFTGASRDIGFGLKTGQEDIAYATGKTNLATSGTLVTQEKDLLAKAKSDITKLVETRALSRTQADLLYRKGEMSAEEAYQSTLTQLESQPTTFLEGMFS